MVELPAVMVVADAVKLKALGVPVQAGGVLVAVGAGAPGTITLMLTVEPNSAAFGARIRHEPA